MDILKLVTDSKPMKTIVGKTIGKYFQKKTGKSADIVVNNLTVVNDGQKVRVHIDVDGEMTSEAFYNLLEDYLA